MASARNSQNNPLDTPQGEPWTLPHMIATVRPWFDAAMYAREYRDVTGSAEELLLHFLGRGWKEGRNPNPDFDTLAYLRAHPDVLLHGLNPIYHYAYTGQAEARVTSPAVLPSRAALMILGGDPGDWVALLTPHVDIEFYAGLLGAEADGSFDLVAHYAYRGWLDGLDPNPEFDTREVLASNTDLLRKQLNPLVHALAITRPPQPEPPPPPEIPAETAAVPPETDEPVEAPRFGPAAFADAADRMAGLREALADANIRQTPNPAHYADETERVIAAELDGPFYRVLNGDVVAAGMDPVTHYHRHGWQDGRNPAPWFDTRYYLATNADVRASGTDPFLHYLRNGRKEGRLPKSPANWRRTLLDHAAEPKAATRQLASPGLSATALARELRAACEGRAGLTVSVESFAPRQQASGGEPGQPTLTVLPARQSPLLAGPDDRAVPLRLLLDGADVGLSDYTGLEAALQACAPQIGSRRTFAVHGILGHSVGGLAALQLALGSTDNLFWVHDYAALCPGHRLLRNDATYCAAPPVDSLECRICVYGGVRPAHVAQVATLFAAVPFTAVAPSQAGLDVWQQGPFQTAARVEDEDGMPPMEGSSKDPASLGTPGNPVRVATVGRPTVAEDGPIWFDLLNRVAGTGAYRFAYFGDPEAGLPVPGLEHVRVPAGDAGAMAAALAAADTDLVLTLSLWPEPLSTVGLAAITAGADIVCFRDSGHAAELARRHRRGVIAADAEALIRFFESLDAVDYVRRSREAA